MNKLKSNKRSKLSVLPVVPVGDYQAGSQWWIASHEPTLSTVPSVSGELITVMGPYSPGAVVSVPSTARNRAVSRAERNASFIGPVLPLVESVKVARRVVDKQGKALPVSVFATGGNGASGFYDLAGNKQGKAEHVPTSRKLVTSSADYVSGLEIVGRSGVCSFEGEDCRFESDDQSQCDEPAFESAKAASAWASLGESGQADQRQAFATKQLDFRSRWAASPCAARLSMLADYVGRRMGRRFGNVSETSKLEAGLAGRAAVIAACSFSFGGDVGSGTGFVESFFMAVGSQEAYYADNPEDDRDSGFTILSRIALSAGSSSLLHELTGGQTGTAAELQRLRQVSVEHNLAQPDFVGPRLPLDEPISSVSCVGSFQYPLDGGDSLPCAVRESFASDCCAMVKTALTSRLSSGIHGAIAINRFKRSASKVSAVLSSVASGESLQAACEQYGYAWEASHNRSKGFSAAMDCLGLGGYCVGRASASVAPLLDDSPARGYTLSLGSRLVSGTDAKFEAVESIPLRTWAGLPDYIPAP
jgi:hypothetical protein